jgi:hypothetical protein
MELRISDNFEDIPENKPAAKAQNIKVVKQQAQIQQPIQTIKPSLSGVKSRMVRPQTPAPKPKVSYDDILTNMGMYLEDGKLRLMTNKSSGPVTKPQVSSQPLQQSERPLQQSARPLQQSERPLQQSARPLQQSARPLQQSAQQPIKQSTSLKPLEQNNSYIYQKYFKNGSTTEEEGIRRPQTIQEYRNMLISDIIQKYKIKQIKSSKLIMPTSNINFAQGPSGNLNKLFSFSQR